MRATMAWAGVAFARVASAAEYAALKAALAERYRYDREAYTEAKGAFVRETLERARGSVDTP